MKDRIKQLMESQHMTQQTFSDFIGISSASLSSIFNDRTKPTLNTVEAIRNKFPTISLDWLMYGKGMMFLDDTPGQDDVQNGTGASDGEQTLMFSDPPSSTPAVQSGRSSGAVTPPNYHTTSNRQVLNAKIFDKPQRNITEIRIFFDDQTWETFVPKK